MRPDQLEGSLDDVVARDQGLAPRAAGARTLGKLQPVGGAWEISKWRWRERWGHEGGRGEARIITKS